MKKLVGAQHGAVHPLATKIPERFIGIFVEPSLLDGEDPSEYWNFVSGMIDCCAPKDMFDCIDIHDFSKDLWEQRACGRYVDAIIRAGKRLAIEQCLSEIAPGEKEISSKLRENAVPLRANRCFSRVKKERDEVLSKLAEFGMGEAEFLARSAQNNIRSIAILEKIISARRRSRRKLQDEMRRRQSSQEVKSESQRAVNAGHLEPRQVINPEANDNAKAHHHVSPGPSQGLENASTNGKGIHGSCQEVKPDQDVDEQPLELRIAMIDDVGAHRGH